MEKFSFFNDINDDRIYYAEDFARHLKKYFTNGIFNSELQVIANDDMTITIREGDANIEGYRYTNTGDLTLSVETADGTLKRIDNVVIRLDLTNRLISAQIVQGTFADNPTAPTLVRSSTIYDLKLAEIYIDAGITSITQSMITDYRFDEDVCGVVVSTVKTLDTDEIYNQLYTKFNEYITENEETFNTWFENVKNQLSTDVAGNLQNEIDTINNNIDEIEENVLYFELSREIEESEKVYKTKNNELIDSSCIAHLSELLSDVLNRPNAGFHNSIYRGKDITDLFYDGTLSEQIANGTFDDIFIGDYIIGKESGRKYLVADINYRLHCGDTECTTPHVLMIPDLSMGTEQMNTSNITDGAYVGSAMYKSNLSAYKTIIQNDFGTDHILKHRNHLQNAVTSSYESGGTWYDSTIELMNELMVYGANIWHNVLNGTTLPNAYEIDKSQLALFRLDKSHIVAFNDSGSRQTWWLRSVTSSAYFCSVANTGVCIRYDASNSYGVRPAFLIY